MSTTTIREAGKALVKLAEAAERPGVSEVLLNMRLSTKRHGYVSAFYYKNPATSHRYKLNGRTAAEILDWMFRHIPDRRSDINKGDLQLVPWRWDCRLGCFYGKKGVFGRTRWYRTADSLGVAGTPY